MSLFRGWSLALFTLVMVAIIMYLFVEDETRWIEETSQVARFNQIEKTSEELYRLRYRVQSTCKYRLSVSLSLPIHMHTHTHTQS
jgi:hypothetical protein